MSQNTNNAFLNAQKQMKTSFDLMKEFENRPDAFDVIANPKRVIEVTIPVKMDDGSTKVFTWYRSQHNNARGPYKGGIRFHTDVSYDEVKALSMWMSIKTWVVDIPLWGGKWGVIVDPKKLSLWELERLSRGYVREIFQYIGPLEDIPAPDVNTTPQIMAWMVDEYSRLAWVPSPGAFTGKPVIFWGSLWRDKATAQGGVYVLQKILELKEISLQWKTVAIQWAGNAWLTVAHLLQELGANIVAISDSSGGIYDEKWLDIHKISELKKSKKSVVEYNTGKQITNEEILELSVDILVPAALENQITQKNAKNIQAHIILELANGPVTPEADEILFKNWVTIIPDILANAWGVMVSYFEQVQNNMNYYWSAGEVDSKLKEKITSAALWVYMMSQNHTVMLRTGAYMISMKRILDAMKARGEI